MRSVITHLVSCTDPSAIGSCILVLSQYNLVVLVDKSARNADGMSCTSITEAHRKLFDDSRDCSLGARRKERSKCGLI